MTFAIAIGVQAMSTAASPASSSSSIAPTVGCSGSNGRPIGFTERGYRHLLDGSPLFGTWVAPSGTLTLGVSPRQMGDTFEDVIGGSWRSEDGDSADIRDAMYEPPGRRLTLAFMGGASLSAPPRLRLAPGGEALISEDGRGTPMRLVRSVAQPVLSVQDFTAASGLSFRFDLEIGFEYPSVPAPGSFVCMGVTSASPGAWDPFKYFAAGHTRRSGEGAFTLQAFFDGSIRRFLSVPSAATRGRLRVIREGSHLFALADDGGGWTPIGMHAMNLWDDVRPIVTLRGGVRASGLRITAR